MERLAKKDADEGVTRQTLSDTQKAEIAGVRQKYQAKLAEREILHHADLAKTADPAEREKLRRAVPARPRSLWTRGGGPGSQDPRAR